jgi:hypothetical protein
MAEIETTCNESQCIVGFLSSRDQNINRSAKFDALNGIESPGLLNTVCGRCITDRKSALDLESKMKKPSPQEILAASIAMNRGISFRDLSSILADFPTDSLSLVHSSISSTTNPESLSILTYEESG